MIVRTSALLFAVLIFAGGAAAQSSGSNPVRYQYHVTGVVLDEYGKPAAKITVCWWPAERPINGRIPCVVSDADGRYDLTVSDIPDKYVVVADNGPGIVLINPKARKHPYRQGGSDVLEFGPRDESRTINLQLHRYKWSKTTRKFEQVSSGFG